MGYMIVYDEEDDMDRAENNYNSQVAEELKDTLDDQHRQIQSKNAPHELSKRFHNVFKRDGINWAEEDFEVNSKEFRAMCVIVNEYNAVVYFGVVDKETENQEKFLKKCGRRSEEILEIVNQKANQSSS